jgi:hypothetical protein
VPPTGTRRARSVPPVDDVTLPAEDETPPPALRAKRQARRVQAATAEPAVRLPEDERAVEDSGGLKAPIAGRYFRLSDSIGLMPLMEWAAAREDIDPQDAAQLVGLYRILQDLVHPGDWAEFKTHTRKEKCIDEDFVAFQAAAMEAIAALPTGGPVTS